MIAFMIYCGVSLRSKAAQNSIILKTKHRVRGVCDGVVVDCGGIALKQSVRFLNRVTAN
jgi:hypothetical protein